MKHEWRCVACREQFELPVGQTPHYCPQCGTPDPRRVWGVSIVWPKDRRGH